MELWPLQVGVKWASDPFIYKAIYRGPMTPIRKWWPEPTEDTPSTGLRRRLHTAFSSQIRQAPGVRSFRWTTDSSLQHTAAVRQLSTQHCHLASWGKSTLETYTTSFKVTLLSPTWRSPTTLERDMFSPPHHQSSTNCIYNPIQPNCAILCVHRN